MRRLTFGIAVSEAAQQTHTLVAGLHGNIFSSSSSLFSAVTCINKRQKKGRRGGQVVCATFVYMMHLIIIPCIVSGAATINIMCTPSFLGRHFYYMPQRRQTARAVDTI